MPWPYNTGGRFRPRKPDPPKPSPEWLADLAAIDAARRDQPASVDGLKCCPKCGATRGVLLVTAPEGGRKYARHQRGRCLKCGRGGPARYGATAARDAWNEIDRSHLT